MEFSELLNQRVSGVEVRTYARLDHHAVGLSRKHGYRELLLLHLRVFFQRIAHYIKIDNLAVDKFHLQMGTIFIYT